MAEVASAYVSILPSAKGFGRSLDNQTRGDLAKSGRRAGLTWGKTFAIGAGLLVAKKATEFLGSTISAASDLNESLNAVNVTYGKQAGAVKTLGKQAATSLGLSRGEFNDLAVRFSNFADTVSGGGKATVGVLDDLTTRAADFASVMNLDVAEAATLFQSGLAGETEPLRRFGIDMSAAKVEAFALASGMVKSKDDMTEAIKVQARYRLLMKATAKTQGDFANTSDGLANKQRILGARFDNLKAVIGNNLLPIMATFVGFLSDTVVPGIEDFAGDAKRLFNKAKEPVKDFFTAVGDSEVFQKTVEGIATAAGKIKSGFKGAASALKGLDFSNLDSKQVGKFLGDAIAQGLNKVVELAPKLFKALGAMFAKVDWVGLGIEFGKQVPALLTGLAVGILAFDPLPILQGLAEHWQEVLIAVLTIAFLPAKLLSPLTTILGKIPFVGAFLARSVTWLNEIGGKLVTFGGDLFKALWKGFTGGRALPGAGLVVKILSALKGLPGAIGRFFANLRDYIGVLALEAFERIGVGARRALVGVLRFVASIPGRILSALGSLLRLLSPRGADLVEGLLRAIRDRATAVFNFVKGIPGRILSALGNVGSLLVSAGADIVRGLINGIKSMAGAAADAAIGVVKGALDKAKGFLKIGSPSKKFEEVGMWSMRGLSDGIKKHGKKVVDQMRSLAGEVSSAFTQDLFGGNLADLFSTGASSVAGLKATKAALKTLKGFGASDSFIKALFASGNTALIGQLAGSDKATVKAAQSLFGQQNTLADQLGNRVGSTVLGDEVRGVRKEIRELRKDLRENAREFGRELNSASRRAGRNSGRWDVAWA